VPVEHPFADALEVRFAVSVDGNATASRLTRIERPLSIIRHNRGKEGVS
jgi:hypothetical protein